MLQYLPRLVGAALRDHRPGRSKLAIHRPQAVNTPPSLTLLSPVFADGGHVPQKYTADGDGLSPPLVWRGVPEGTIRLVLMVEDADSPTPEPLVHAIVPALPLRRVDLTEGEISRGVHALGRNSYLRATYLPPDPPPGHGPHRYAFQLFALGQGATLPDAPGRGDVLGAMDGHLLAKGCLIGLYGRS